MQATGRRPRVTLRQLGPWYGFAVTVLKPLVLLLTRRTWRGQEHVPAQGGAILAVNHISHADPVLVADFVVFGARRIARFLAKSTLFRKGFVGAVMRGAAQIPVHRGTADASLALHDAVEALQRGEVVVLYPEGTVSRDPDKWPMVARTGVARLALLADAPVIPVGQWGAQQLLDSYRGNTVQLVPRPRVQIAAGPPVDLSRFRGQELTAEVLREATDEVMAAVTRLVEELRGEKAPAAPYDPRAALPAAGADERRTA